MPLQMLIDNRFMQNFIKIIRMYKFENKKLSFRLKLVMDWINNKIYKFGIIIISSGVCAEIQI